jgi:hypothetical protein
VTRAFDDVMGDTNIATPFKPHIHTYKFAHVSQTLPSSIPTLSSPSASCRGHYIICLLAYSYAPARVLMHDIRL